MAIRLPSPAASNTLRNDTDDMRLAMLLLKKALRPRKLIDRERSPTEKVHRPRTHQPRTLTNRESSSTEKVHQPRNLIDQESSQATIVPDTRPPVTAILTKPSAPLSNPSRNENILANLQTDSPYPRRVDTQTAEHRPPNLAPTLGIVSIRDVQR